MPPSGGPLSQAGADAVPAVLIDPKSKKNRIQPSDPPYSGRHKSRGRERGKLPPERVEKFDTLPGGPSPPRYDSGSP